MKIARVTNHAIDRAVERFNVKRNVAENWIRHALGRAKYVSEYLSEEGKAAHLYATDGVCFVINAEQDTVITVYKPRVPSSLYEKVVGIAQRELAKLERLERKVTRNHTLLKAELQIELAELNLRKLRARSQASKNACQARINAINERIVELDAEVVEAKRNKSIVAKGVAAYL